MSELSHDEVSYLLLRGHLSSSEREALRNHLAHCSACRRNATMHVFLERELPREVAYAANAHAFRQRFLDKVRQVESRKQWNAPFQALATVAMAALLLTVGWVFWSMQAGQSQTAVQPPARLELEVPPAAAASPVAEPSVVAPGSVTTADIPAPALQRARLPQGARQTIAIYLPPSYQLSDRRYPVVYWLTAGEGPRSGPHGIGEAQQVMDDLLAAGQVQEMIVVVPPIRNVYGHSIFYHNSPVTGNWADFLLHDVVGYVDANLRTIPEAQSRGLGGEALTATNALEIAMLNPGVFGALYLKHPLLFAPDAMNESFLTSAQAVHPVRSLLSELGELPPQEAHERYVAYLREHTERLDSTMTLDYGMTYVPRPDGRAPYFDYFYLRDDDRVSEEIWAQWEQGFGNLAEKIARHAEALHQLNGLHVEYSRHSTSFAWSYDGAPYLAEQLEVNGVPFSLQEYLGGAVLDNVTRMRLVMFPFFSEVLAGP